MTSPDRTNWDIYGLADIWDMVSKDNFNNSGHVDSWERMRVLCSAMAEALRKAADQLAERWPPSKHPAAAVFKLKLDGLVVAFTEAAKAAGTNGGTLNTVNLGFAVNHHGISQLVTSWQQYQKKEATRVAIARSGVALASAPLQIFSAAAPVIINGSMSDQAVLAASNTPPIKYAVDAAGGPEVPTNWRSQHNSLARGVMTATDQELVQARSQVVPPPVLLPNQEIIDGTWPPRATGGGGEGFGGGTGGGFSGTFTPPSMPVFAPTSPDRSPVVDPVLSGGPGPGGIPPGYPSGYPGGPPVTGFPPIGPTQPGGLGTVPWVTTPVGKALATGIPIGEPGTGGARAGMGGMMPMGGGRPASNGGTGGAAKGGFVAPPGGMIGGRPTTRGGMGTSIPGAKRRRREDDDDGWAVASGVPAVLTPDPEPDEHDPGPGVIGIDR